MSRPNQLTPILLLSFLIFIIGFASAQRLPEGKFHQNRQRELDILHYKADLHFNFKQQSVAGEATITFTPLGKITKLSLDAIGAMEHTGVTGHRWSVLRNESAPLDFSPALYHYYTSWTVILNM